MQAHQILVSFVPTHLYGSQARNILKQYDRLLAVSETSPRTEMLVVNCSHQLLISYRYVLEFGILLLLCTFLKMNLNSFDNTRLD
jgi:hypothetical protein